MYLSKLSLINFKNYDEAIFEFSPTINCFVGNNGVGKTNILDSIHYLSLAKSFYSNIDSSSIRNSEDFFIIEGTFFTEDNYDNIHCSFQRHKQKILKRNGKEYQKLSDHIGRYPVVMISPIDNTLIIGGSSERRKFLNKVISQYNPLYLDSVMNYNKALLQRNKLLKDLNDMGKFDSEMLEIWDKQLLKYGEYIFLERQKFGIELTPVFDEYYAFISSGNEKVKLTYCSQLQEASFAELLRKSADKDRILEYTTTGIHKDDLIFELNGYPLKIFGSQGQQKSFLVALKLAKFDYLKRKAGFAPILLLDDIFDKFDSERVEKIIDLAGNNRFGQIFITDTDEVRMRNVLSRFKADYRFFRIEKANKILLIS
ncbi:MAG TPA: DNA replication/repair protein RecF [Bacteroidales bacterium]|nr:DNA replication/repair protein RecF [Bacteroidales bacterium]